MKRPLTRILMILVICILGDPTAAQKPLSYKDGVFELDRGNFHVAFVTFKRLAEQGDVRSQQDLAFMYMIGYVGKQDFEMGAKWLKKAANSGLAKAQYSLGELYETGRGVAHDKIKALQWYWTSSHMTHRAQRQILSRSKIEDLEHRMSAKEISRARVLACNWAKDVKGKFEIPKAIHSVCSSD